MAMNKDTMAALIVGKITTANPDITPAEATKIEAHFKLVCDGIIEHMMAAAEITVASGIAVSTLGGPGQTTATGTGTIE